MDRSVFNKITSSCWKLKFDPRKKSIIRMDRPLSVDRPSTIPRAGIIKKNGKNHYINPNYTLRPFTFWLSDRSSLAAPPSFYQKTVHSGSITFGWVIHFGRTVHFFHPDSIVLCNQLHFSNHFLMHTWLHIHFFHTRSPHIDTSSFEIFVLGNNISLWRNINLDLKT